MVNDLLVRLSVPLVLSIIVSPLLYYYILYITCVVWNILLLFSWTNHCCGHHKFGAKWCGDETQNEIFLHNYNTEQRNFIVNFLTLQQVFWIMFVGDKKPIKRPIPYYPAYRHCAYKWIRCGFEKMWRKNWQFSVLNSLIYSPTN